MSNDLRKSGHEPAQRTSITVEVHGGLGNQMFQYAAGRALALRLKCPLVLDTRWFQTHAQRLFELPLFNHAGHTCRPGLASSALSRFGPGRKLVYALKKRAGTLIDERSHPGLPESLNTLKAGHYLSGYWQSESYFREFAAQIRQDFTFPGTVNEPTRAMLRTLSMGNWVSLHVRRQDYVSVAANRQIFASCSPDYYARALKTVTQATVGSCRCAVFSDDISWSRNNLDLPKNTVFIDWNRGADSWQDMLLMSRCSHHVIANSSFSWWGAWLNASPDKLVICPRDWIHENDFSIRSSAPRTPDSWTPIDN